MGMKLELAVTALAPSTAGLCVLPDVAGLQFPPSLAMLAWAAGSWESSSI